MSESKHTPGPWRIEPDRITDQYYHHITAGAGMAQIEPGDDIDDGFSFHAFLSAADARLISCAPELLEALEYMVANIGQPNCLETRDGFKQARSIIAKARGSQNAS